MKQSTKAALGILGVLALGGVVHAVNSDPEPPSEPAVARFRASGVGQIGIRTNSEYDPTPFGGPLRRHPEIETRAFWVQLPAGRRLALYRRGHTHVPAVGDERCLLGAGCYPISKEEADFLAERDRADNTFQFERFVADEFRDAAIAVHSARWQSAPEDHQAGIVELLSTAG